MTFFDFNVPQLGLGQFTVQLTGAVYVAVLSQDRSALNTAVTVWLDPSAVRPVMV